MQLPLWIGSAVNEQQCLTGRLSPLLEIALLHAQFSHLSPARRLIDTRLLSER